MNFNGWGNFEDLLRACGYTTSSDNEDSIGCSDIPNGFQTIPPELFVIIGTVLANIIAGSVPFNVQIAVGNWLELVGRAILTYNAQQQYFQEGPGRYSNPKNYNIDNPFCNPTTNTSSNSNNSTSSKTSKSRSNDIDKMKDLEKQVQELTNEINKIKILLQKI